MYRIFVKRVLDVVLCSIALIVLSPIFLITAIAIKISSPGPVIYHSERTGKNHKKFHFYKFRSMHVTNSDKGMFVADSERLFFVGNLIRRLKIDELPQLINVIKGDMSIVGPRPMPYNSVDTTYYGKYQKILSVKPGLTSAASLYDYIVGDTYTDNDLYIRDVLPVKLEMEMLYLKKQCFAYDAELVCRTISTIFQVIIGRKKYNQMPEMKEIKKREMKKKGSEVVR
ncbi:MAG: sugar transferase [Ruminococcus sp.]|nr:sugar transferase [Ruminococcus sp.]